MASSADWAFLTLPSGERIYCASGFWSRPYILPDEVTEEKLRNKHHILQMFLALGAVVWILVVPIATIAYLEIYSRGSSGLTSPGTASRGGISASEALGAESPGNTVYKTSSELYRYTDSNKEDWITLAIILAYLLLLYGLFTATRKFILGKELKRLQRSATRIPVKTYSVLVASKFSTKELVRTLLLFVALFTFNAWYSWSNDGSGLLWAVVMGFFSIQFCYMLYLKTKNHRP
jgi:hypothetical protein